MKNGIEGVAFDLDGTLYPDRRLHRKIVHLVLKEWRLVAAFSKTRKIIRKEQENTQNFPDDFYQYQADVTAKILFGENYEPLHQPLKEIIENRIYKAWETPFKAIRLFKGVKETLIALREAGYKLGLLSDFPPEKKLKYLGLSDIWDAVLCSEQCGALKPHPLSFQKLAQAMTLPPEKVLYVGNSHPYDVTGANRAGMKTAWIKPKFAPAGRKKPAADFAFSDYRQLHNFLITSNDV